MIIVIIFILLGLGILSTMISNLTDSLKTNKREPYVYKLEERRSWGDSICLDTSNPNKLKAHGWISSPRISKGDILTYTSQSNHEIKLRFTKVEYCRDPHDMFFAELKLID